MCSNCSEPVHHWFGLTYSSYMVLHRTALQDMPPEWQKKFVALIEEMEERYDTSQVPSTFHVQPRGLDGKFQSDPFSDYRRGPKLPLRPDTPAELV